MRRRLFAQSAFILATGMAGCASAVTHDYRMIPTAGVPRNTAAGVIEIRSIGIPAYLDQDNIAKPGGAAEFSSYANDLWAAPLAGMLQAVMVQDLSQRLPGSTILGSNGAISSPAQAVVEIEVLQFDPMPDGGIQLSMQTALKSGKDHSLLVMQSWSASAQPASSTAMDIVRAMSTLWGLAADQIASMIVAGIAR